jgi:membrane protein YqaA with SNARE-associated domain
MKALFYSLLGYFLTPAGLVIMGALDSSLVFFLPLGIDFVVIILSARNPDLFWLYAPLATVGSVLGAGLTFWIGRKVGEHGLSRLIPPKRLKRIQQRVGQKAAVSVAALAIIPPPFPFTAFVVTSGAVRPMPGRSSRRLQPSGCSGSASKAPWPRATAAASCRSCSRRPSPWSSA